MNDIATLVENYQPVLQDPNEFRDTKIILFVGITGSGKNTMISELMKTDYKVMVSVKNNQLPKTIHLLIKL